MTIRLSWNDDQSIAYAMFEQHWTVDDLCHINDQITYVMNTVNHPVHIIAYTELDGSLPPGFANQVKQIYKATHQKAGYAVIIGNKPLVRKLFQPNTKLYSFVVPDSDIQFAGDLNEALALIADFERVAR